MTARRGARAAFGALLCAAVTLSGSAGAATPEQLFAADASGTVKIVARCPTGSEQGSGFLLGPRVVMTARQTLVDSRGQGCQASVVQQGTGTTVSIRQWTAIRVAGSHASTDLAIALLASPLGGFDFSISRMSPLPKERVAALGYALGQPLGFNQGQVIGLRTLQQVRVIELNLLEGSGAVGGPILDGAGDVVGVIQSTLDGVTQSVDLAHLVGGNPAQLCFAAAAAQEATVCSSARPTPALLAPDGSPPLCAGAAIEPPFAACPLQLNDLSGVVTMRASCPDGYGWSGAGFLLGPRVVMTARDLLIDPTNGGTCPMTVEGLGEKPVAISGWTPVQVAGSGAATDVALAVLAGPIAGYDYTLSPTSPAVGEPVRLFGLRGSSFGFVGTRVSKRETLNGVPILEASAKLSGLSAGEPVLNFDNQVVGLVQWGDSPSTTISVDLAGISGGDRAQFCLGEARSQSSTVCTSGKAPSAARLVVGGPPPICDGVTAVPPFTICTSPANEPVDSTQPAGTSPAPGVDTRPSCEVMYPPGSAEAGIKVETVSDVTEELAFEWTLVEAVPNGTTLSVTLTSPVGQATAVPLQIGASAALAAGSYSTSFSFPTNPVADGIWLITVSYSNGTSCTSGVVVIHG